MAGRPSGLRPTLGVVVQALYNSLGEDTGSARVLDLFAGSGALGLEALRRGAAHVTFVEADARRAADLRRATRSLPAEVRRGRVPGALDALEREGRVYDVIVLDPPYGRGLQRATLERLAASPLLAPGGVVVAEGHWRDDPGEAIEPLRRVRSARYGETALWFYRRTPGAGEAGRGGRLE